jgi:hypothetical protein
MPPQPNTSTYWRDRAKEIRAIAQKTKDPQARRITLRIADWYDELMEWADDVGKGTIN